MSAAEPMDQKRLRLGIAGLGRAFSLMLPTLAGDARIQMVAGADPRAEARAQFFYGLSETPKLARGRVELRLALLSPAQRPVAITADLAGFWRGAWADVRKDMRGRYPRHHWPDDPATASARRASSSRCARAPPASMTRMPTAACR